MLGLLLMFLTMRFRSSVLDDAGPVVLVAIIAIISMQGLLDLDVAFALRSVEPEFGESGPWSLLWLTLIGILVSDVTGWRSLAAPQHATAWALGAAALAPTVMVATALCWEPTIQL